MGLKFVEQFSDSKAEDFHCVKKKKKKKEEESCSLIPRVFSKHSRD